MRASLIPLHGHFLCPVTRSDWAARFSSLLAGRRRVVARRQRTRIDWAHEVEHLQTIDYRYAERVVLVMDNLNTTGSRYEALEAASPRTRRAADAFVALVRDRPR